MDTNLTKLEKRTRSDEFARRLSQYGGETIQVVEQLPDNKPGRHVADQLMRCATAPGAHYEEARGAQSRDDFVYSTIQDQTADV